jgi:hypothetical protein
MIIDERSVIFLLGAGCSCDADVPMSSNMLSKIESLIESDHNWKKYHSLYYYVKHTIEYGIKLNGIPKDFNIELLLIVLHALADYKEALVYPFILGYSSDLKEYAGDNFEEIRNLIEAIEKEVPHWVTLGNYSKASYYNGFEKFQKEYNHIVRIFSLNYDLCLEENIETGLETGFPDNEPWDGNKFYKNDDEAETPLYLYKLHGSIDWERKDNQLRRSRQHGIKPEIIFGTDMKIQAVDPYLFYLYELRKYAFTARIIIVIGYSFNDNHINDILRQAIELNNDKKIICVAPTNKSTGEVLRILGRLKLKDNPSNKAKISCENYSAKHFLENILSLEYVSKQTPPEDLPF